MPKFHGDPKEYTQAEFDAKWQQLALQREPFTPAVTYSKKQLFEAMTDAEYDMWEVAEKQQSKRKARMLKEALYLDANDPWFNELRSAMITVFGESRTSELLTAAQE